jgi:hypothetical protein
VHGATLKFAVLFCEVSSRTARFKDADESFWWTHVSFLAGQDGAMYRLNALRIELCTHADLRYNIEVSEQLSNLKQKRNCQQVLGTWQDDLYKSSVVRARL